VLINDEEEKKKRQEEFLNMVNTINDEDFNSETYDNNVSFNNNISNQKEQEFFQMVNSINPYTEETSSDIDISPDLDTSTIDSTIQNEEQTENKKKVEIFKGSKALDDGYQFGDISRSAIATVTDVANRLAEGFSSPFESVVDIGAHAVATIQSLTGHEEASKKTREWADKDVIKEVAESDQYTPVKAFYNFASGNEPYWNQFIKTHYFKDGKEVTLLGNEISNEEPKKDHNYKDESMLGETSGQVAELVGYTGGLAAGTYLLGGAGNISVAIGNTTLNLPTLAVVGGASGGLKEADSKGENVSEVERWSKAITGGLIEGTTEGLFGMFGVGGTELTDIWASKAASKMSTGAGKILAKLGVQSTGEAAEEFLSYLGNYIVDNGLIDKLGDADFSTKWDWGEVGEQAALAFVSSAISLGGESYINTNQSIKAAEEQLGRELTPQEKTSVIKAITEDALIKYDNKELFEDGEESVGNYFVANYDENGEVGEVVETLGKAIENPNSNLDIQPVIIKDQQNKTFNVIDGQTGMLLDTTPYTSVQEAVDGFTEIVSNMSEAQIESVNNNVADSTLALYAEIGKMIQERQSQNITSQNQQNNTIEQNIIQGQEINSKNNKNAQNGFSNQIKTTMEQRTFENVSDKNVKSYQTENPEVSQEIQEMAYNFQEDLANSTFGERYKAGDEWTGTKRSTTKELAEIKDDTGASWGKIQKALEDISQGKGDYALAKKVELVLDKALSEGYKNIYGKNIMPNESYLTKKGKIEGKNYLQNETETSIEIESNPEENRIFGERINKKGGNSNVRSEQNTSKNTRQKINRTAEGENTRGESKNAKGNELVKNSQSKGLSNYQRQQQRTQGKDFKAELVESKSQSPNERIVSKGFKELTGLDLNVYKTNKATTENAFFSDSDVYLKHNSLANKKTTNFLPFHELGHWFKVNRTAEWNTIHDIIDNTITKNQIEEYKNVLNDKSIFDNMSEAEIREYVIEEIESDYFGNWANDISNWENMLDIMPTEYQNLLADISLENISTHFNIFGTQEQQEQVYEQINEMMNNFIVENKNALKTNSENNIKYSFRNDAKEGQYWQIEESKDLFKGITKTETLQDKAYKLILHGNKNFETITDKVNGKDVQFIRVSAREYVYGINAQELTDKSGTEAYNKKMRMSPSIKDLIDNASTTYKSPLTHKSNLFSEFTNYQGKVGIDDYIFKYIVRVGKGKKKGDSIFYDLSLELLKGQKNKADKKSLVSKNDTSLKSASINNSIAQKNKTVKSDTATNSNNMQKSKNNTIKKSDRIDTNVVATDNQGRKLSKEQQEYFRDSKVRDEDDNLLVMYHGTKDVFTIFKNEKNKYDSGFAGEGFYFTSDYKSAQDYSNWKKGNDNFVPKVMSVYIDAKKPLIIGDFSNGIKTAVGEKLGIEFKTKNPLTITKEDSQKITETLIKKGYDSVIFKAANNPTEQIVMVINSNQIKNVDNKKPTDNPDIRYSNRADMDSEGRELSREQQEFFKDSKVRDENGKLKVVYHGTDADFTVFDYRNLGKNGTSNGKGFYFTDQQEVASQYSDGSNIIKAYVNIQKPLRNTRSAISQEQYIKLAEAINDKTNGLYFTDMGDGTPVKKGSVEYNRIIDDLKHDYAFGGDDVDLITGILNSANLKLEEGYRVLRETLGYDGIIGEVPYRNSRGNWTSYNLYIAFTPEQIKNVDNKKPTNNPDIRYSNRYDTEENGEGGFYSQLEKVIEEKMPNTSNAQQIKGIIENSGIKQDEIKWIGLDDYLKQHSLEKISKQQLQDYIKANQINIETVNKSDAEYRRYENDKKIASNKYTEATANLSNYLSKIGEKNNINDISEQDRIVHTFSTKYGINSFREGDSKELVIQTLNDVYSNISGKQNIHFKMSENESKELIRLADEYLETSNNYLNFDEKFQENYDIQDSPQYSNYKLEGGTNYQEILYTLPYEQNGNDVKNLQIANVDEYNSPHWQENNVLAHARTQDFEDTAGNKVLFIDEIQSDLHQEGRKKGYFAKSDMDTLNKLKKQLDDLNDTYAIYEDEAQELTNKGYSAAREYYVEHQNRAIDNLSHLEEEFKINEKLTKEQQYELLDYEDKITQQLLLVNKYDNFGDNIESEPYMMTKIKEAEENLDLTLSKDILEKQPQKTIYRKRALEDFKVEYYNLGNIHNVVWGKNIRKYLSNEDQKRYDFLDNETDKLINQRNQLQDEIDRFNKGIPDVFPFKKNWHEFVLRRMINNAVEQGYDEVAWTTGKQQRERYSLSKAIDSLRYKKFFDSSDNVTQVAIVGIKNNEEIFDKRIYLKEESLEDYIGKDLANKILKSKKEAATINNLDANIDSNTNNGMYVFYDQEIPNYLNKYLKKWNSKVEEIILKDADGKTESKQMGFKITDEMRNSIKQNGQPLFSNRKLDDEESSTYDERIQRKNKELIKELREQKENIQGLEGYSRNEIKDIVSNYIQDKLVENDLEDISINGAEIIGSRNRGNAKTNSDLDLVVEYSGDIREDDLFNILNEEPLEIEGIKVDINPITADNTGTLEEYLERSRQYDREVLNTTKKETIRKEDPNVAPGATNAQGANRFIEQEIRKIEASGNWDNSIPVTKLTDIRKTIEDYLGLGIKKGHFRERAYGIYKEGRDVIRGKELKDIDNILHETGHALDLGNRLKIDKESIANELLTAIQKHGGYENETRSTKLDEGFAEVIRTYSIIPEQAKTDYPQSVAVLEEIRKADKSFDDFIRKVQQQTYNYIHQNPQNRVHSNISVGESNRTPLTKAWLEQEVMRNIWDKDYAVKKVVSEIAKIGGKTTNQIKASNNAYYLTRLATGIHDKVTSMLSDGYINEKGEKIMPGLNKVGEILGDDAQRYNDLRDYLVAKRDTDYKAKTLKTGIRDMDTKYVLEKFANDTQIKDAAQVVYDTLDGVMQYAVDNGLISEDDVKSLKESNAFYVPMQRVIEGKGNQLGRKGAVSDIIKARTGSELDIKDVLENIVSNSTNIIQQVENNNVLRALYNQGEEAGLTGSIYDVIPAPMMKVGTANLSMWENELKKQGVNTTELDLEKTVDIFAPNNKIDTKNLITSFIDTNGKRVYLQFNDEILFNSLMNLDGKMMSNVLKINSKLNMPLRYGATMANIGFAIPNMISDTAQAAIFSNAGFIPVVDNALGVLDILTATNKHVRNFVKNYSPEYVNRIENMYNLYRQSGATSSTRMSQFRDSTQSNMKDIYGTKNSKVLGINEKWKPLKRLLDIMTYIPEISEQSTRFRVFERNYDMYKSKGNSEMDSRILAALESRDATQDFGRTGNLTREINQLIPFSAARVGSSYTFAEKVKANPKRTAMRIAILSAIALAIKAIGYDDKEIEELIQRKKDDNFVMRVGDKIVTIKKPQGLLRSIVNLTEYIEDLATGHIEEGKEGERLGEWINNAIMDNAPADSVTGLVPNMVAPLIENAINKDLYYNTDIVKSYDLELPDSQQYYEYNSQLAILLGKVFNYSPAKIDNLISGYFAGLGTQVTNIMDYASGKLGITAQKAEMGAESNAVGKRFIVNVNSNSASVDEIYNRKTELTKKKNGGTITSEEETELSNITAAVSNMSKVNKQIKEIKRDLTMSGREKAEQIKELQRQRTDIARQALGKDLLDDTNSEKIETTSFYPTNSSLSLNKMTLELTPEMKEEYSKLASEFYKKYEKQGLYSQNKLKQIKTKAKDYAKKTLMKKYKSQLVKSK
jgi:predicted nucleotidyltransferase